MSVITIFLVFYLICLFPLLSYDHLIANMSPHAFFPVISLGFQVLLDCNSSENAIDVLCKITFNQNLFKFFS